MEVKATAKYTRISPRKVRLVVDLVRGKRIDQALDQLKFLHKKASVPVRKVVESAIANAEHNYDLKKDNLYVKEIRVDGGRTLHRWMPRAHGRATPIRKRTSNINVVLAEIVDSGEVAPKKQDIEAPVNLQQMTEQQEKGEKKEAKATTREGGEQKKGKQEKESRQKDPQQEMSSKRKDTSSNTKQK